MSHDYHICRDGQARIHKATAMFAVLALSALVSAAASATFIPLGVVDGLKVKDSLGDGVYIVGQYLDGTATRSQCAAAS